MYPQRIEPTVGEGIYVIKKTEAIYLFCVETFFGLFGYSFGVFFGMTV